MQDIVAGVRNGAKRLVVGSTEHGLDIWSRLLPGRVVVSTTGGWLGRLARSSIWLGATVGRREWLALFAGAVVGLEVGLNMHRIARL